MEDIQFDPYQQTSGFSHYQHVFFFMSYPHQSSACRAAATAAAAAAVSMDHQFIPDFISSHQTFWVSRLSSLITSFSLFSLEKKKSRPGFQPLLQARVTLSCSLVCRPDNLYVCERLRVFVCVCVVCVCVCELQRVTDGCLISRAGSPWPVASLDAGVGPRWTLVTIWFRVSY